MVKLRVMNIDTDCTDNGLGLRTTIYLAGCWHYCERCHNAISWSERSGIEMTIDEILEIVEENELADVTLSGGDPLTYQYLATLELAKVIKERTGKNIWVYTGYTLEQLLKDRADILQYIDVLVDGKFEKKNKDLNLVFRGSSNQKIIDIDQFKRTGKIVELF